MLCYGIVSDPSEAQNIDGGCATFWLKNVLVGTETPVDRNSLRQAPHEVLYVITIVLNTWLWQIASGNPRKRISGDVRSLRYPLARDPESSSSLSAVLSISSACYERDR